MCRKFVNKLFIKQTIHHAFKKRSFAPRNNAFFVDFSERLSVKFRKPALFGRVFYQNTAERAWLILSKFLPSARLRAAFRLHSAAF